MAEKFVEEVMDELCRRFELNQTVKELSLDKLKTILSHSSFSSASKTVKRLLSLVCLYLALSEDKPLTIRQICETIAVNVNDFAKVYNQVIKEFPNLKNSTVCVEGLVERTVNEANFEATEKPKLIERIIELLKIADEFGLIEGRSPEYVIQGMAFIAWKSLNASERRKLKLKEFCAVTHIDYKKTISIRVNEIFKALQKMGQKLPQRQSFRFTQQNISVHLNEILEYKASLLLDLQTQIRSTLTKSEANATDPTINWINAFKCKTAKRGAQTGSQLQTIDGKSIKTEEDFSDSEIDCYLRSPKEVKRIKKLKKLFAAQEEEEEETYYQKKVTEEQIGKYIEIDGLN